MILISKSKKVIQLLSFCMWAIGMVVILSSLSLVVMYYRGIIQITDYNSLFSNNISGAKSEDNERVKANYKQSLRLKSASDFSNILSTYKGKKVVAPVEETSTLLEELKKKLVLIGINDSPDRNLICAFIEDTSKDTQQFYFIGDKIYDAVITDISYKKKSVTIEHKGKSVEISLKESESSMLSATDDSTTKEDVEKKTGVKNVKKQVEVGNFKSYQDQDNPNHWYIDKEEKKYVLKNLLKLRNDVKFQLEIRENKGVVGIKVLDIKSDSFLSNRGIQKGDIVKSINGIALSTPASISKILGNTEVIDSKVYKVIVEREGKDIEIQYDIME